MRETTTDDPVFGKLVWDGFEHGGWGGSFADSNYIDWGSQIYALVPDEEENENDDPDAEAARTSAQDFISEMLSVMDSRLEKELENNEQARKMVDSAREFAARRDAYDGSLDQGPLRKRGLLKVVVPNPRDRQPTKQQHDAWRSFRAGGAELAERVAAALLKVYQQQHPERVRWLRSVYGDSPDTLFPVVKSTKAMRNIVLPLEFAVPARPDGRACVAIVFMGLWSNEEIIVLVRDGNVIQVGPHTHSPHSNWSEHVCEEPEEIDSQVFGHLKGARVPGGWTGVFHSDYLRGFDEASKMRFRYRNDPALRTIAFRQLPTWDTITGDFTLEIACSEGEYPTPEQESAFRAFNSDPAATAQQILSAIFDWYCEVRPDWVKHMNGTTDAIESTMPTLTSPEGLLEIIQLQSVCVLDAPSTEDISNSHEIAKSGIAILLYFSWQDEHGLGVRWRNGKIEKIGDWDSVEDE